MKKYTYRIFGPKSGISLQNPGLVGYENVVVVIIIVVPPPPQKKTSLFTIWEMLLLLYPPKKFHVAFHYMVDLQYNPKAVWVLSGVY